jgi:hypothetical protein
MKKILLIAGIGVLLFSLSLNAATYIVKKDGTGDFTTVQACAQVAKPGDRCEVYAGNYPEVITTQSGGTGDSARIVFKAVGLATIQGFSIRHPYITLDGFDISDPAGSIGDFGSHVSVRTAGSYCEILNNTIRDFGPTKVGGISFPTTNSVAADRCVIRGNQMRNLNNQFLTINGGHHLIENNVWEDMRGWDAIRLFGHDHVFRRNVFRNSTYTPGIGNHPDFVQTFANDLLRESYNMLFEQNWIENLDGYQMGQINNGAHNFIGFSPVHHNIVFRNNVFINVTNNMSIVLPRVQFRHNTFYRIATNSGGLSFGGSLTRGDASHGLIKNNVFLASGDRSSNGFYAISGGNLSNEVVQLGASVNLATAENITADLVSKGYINSNGRPQERALSLTRYADFEMNSTFNAHKPVVYDLLTRTVDLFWSIRNTFSADYNYVAGPAPTFEPKNSRASDCAAETYPSFSFCEPNGINGGNPQLRNINNPLGADGIPFTLDDGLKPLPGSPLCGKGEGGVDIGVYSCDPHKIFSDGSPPGTPFDPLPSKVLLSIRKVGNGQGVVSGTGINCGADCSESFGVGTNVTLQASASAGSIFSGWTGACSGKNSLCVVHMNAGKTVTAVFVDENDPVYTGEPIGDLKSMVFNPARGERLAIGLLSGSGSNLEIFDRKGILVQFYPNTNESTEWDGRNQQGQIVAAGVYIVKFVNGSKRVVVVK